MKKLSAPFAKLLAVAACALTLGSCNRAEYAQLPKSPAYYGNTARATAPAAPQQSVAVAPTVAETATLAPVAAPEVAVTPAAPRVAPQPAATAVQSSALASTTARPAAKPTLVQRLLLNKTLKKVDKLVARQHSVKKNDNTASTARLDSGLRTALVVLLIGVIVGAFSGVNSVFAVIGGILIIVGLVLLLLYLLDQA